MVFLMVMVNITQAQLESSLNFFVALTLWNCGNRWLVSWGMMLSSPYFSRNRYTHEERKGVGGVACYRMVTYDEVLIKLVINIKHILNMLNI